MDTLASQTVWSSCASLVGLSSRPSAPTHVLGAEARGGIWAVVVAFGRNSELTRLLTSLVTQTTPLAGAIVVDNANLPSTAEVAARFGAGYVGSAINLGGAGGFALGMLTALARGAQALWLWDDDGFPGDENCLTVLSQCARARGADVVSPLVVSEENPAQTAFAFRVGGRHTTERRRIERRPTFEGFAHLFNGALVQAASLARIGLPDYRLFIRGDEVDFFHRVQRSGGMILTCTSAVAYHPSGQPDLAAVPGLPFSVVYPANAAWRDIVFRNRAYVFLRHHQWLYLFADPLRYGAYFLIRRRPDWVGYRGWLAATLCGYREQFSDVRRPRPLAAEYGADSELARQPRTPPSRRFLLYCKTLFLG